MAEGVDVKMLGDFLRRTRLKKMMRLRQVHDVTGVSIASLSRIERGASGGVDSGTLIRLCEWMEVPMETFTENPQTSQASKKKVESTPDLVELHLRADKKLDKQTAAALAELFRTAYEGFSKAK
jgi:transcriptional regulator with XRE-family HTH domain